MAAFRLNYSLCSRLYLLAIAATAAVTFMPASPQTGAFLLLVLLSLPISFVAAPTTYMFIGLTFADSDSIVPRLMNFVIWMALVALQVAAIGLVRRSLLPERES